MFCVLASATRHVRDAGQVYVQRRSAQPPRRLGIIRTDAAPCDRLRDGTGGDKSVIRVIRPDR